jgi:hypothetical protein
MAPIAFTELRLEGKAMLEKPLFIVHAKCSKPDAAVSAYLSATGAVSINPKLEIVTRALISSAHSSAAKR